MKVTFILGFISILLLSAGQTSVKYGLNQIGGFDFHEGIKGFIKFFHTPWIIIGFLFYGIASIVWMHVLSKLDFSLALPMVSLTYVFTLIIGRFFFGETISIFRIFGVFFILVGIFFLIKSHISS